MNDRQKQIIAALRALANAAEEAAGKGSCAYSELMGLAVQYGNGIGVKRADLAYVMNNELADVLAAEKFFE